VGDWWGIFIYYNYYDMNFGSVMLNCIQSILPIYVKFSPNFLSFLFKARFNIVIIR
jgi:hypothetical protein